MTSKSSLNGQFCSYHQLTFINFDFDVLIMPIVQNAAFFEHWVGAYPFFNQINNEGIELYAV